ncbi:uncharacterized protein LOC116347008 [Contarinia nasturtii]|uniref:uncharacterized protein LOC116347008 n=1 Tax=Contarinia nasturtii TaxID=265458 RepID=UPI0012D43E33|nr:uncharacterized protein LOC116347008 [Contarinia nasturtii]XP_031633236.1 uncharacterized protein LOC116347008 [Contarinia nasturtii]
MTKYIIELQQSLKNDVEKILDKIQKHIFEVSHKTNLEELRLLFGLIMEWFDNLKLFRYSSISENTPANLEGDNVSEEILCEQINCLNMHRKVLEGTDIEWLINQFTRRVLNMFEEIKYQNSQFIPSISTRIAELQQSILASYANDLICVIFNFHERIVTLFEKNLYLNYVIDKFESMLLKSDEGSMYHKFENILYNRYLKPVRTQRNAATIDNMRSL